MFNIQELAELIYEKTINDLNYFVHRSMVVVGNNSTGKSTLLKELLNKIIIEGNDKFYYIDAQNRVVTNSTKAEFSVHYSEFSVRTILTTRFKPDYFAKEDVFDATYSGGVVTYSELMSDLNTYNKLFNNFMSCDLKKGLLMRRDSFIEGNDTLYYKDNIDIGSISSSEAAKIRLIMEINYANNQECKVVIIDEFDDHFDTENMISFMNKLQEYYSKLRFIFVIHNFEAIVRISGFDAIVYNNEKTSPVKIISLDCDDITELGQVYRIRSRYIGKKKSSEVLLSECISELIKCGKIDEKNRKKILLIEREKLNSKEKILYDYIVEHTEDESRITNKI